MKRLLIAFFMLFTLIGVLRASPYSQAMEAGEYCQTPFEAEFARLISEYRVNLGLSPVRPVPMLGAAAKHHAQEAIDSFIAGEGWISHGMRPGNGDWFTNIIDHGYVWGGGEIAALNWWDPTVLFNAFLGSPGHLSTIVEPNFTAIGVGYIQMIDVANTFYADFGNYAGAELGTSPLCGQPTNTPAATNTPTVTPTVTNTPEPTATKTPKPCRNNKSKACRTPTAAPVLVPTQAATPV